MSDPTAPTRTPPTAVRSSFYPFKWVIALILLVGGPLLFLRQPIPTPPDQTLTLIETALDRDGQSSQAPIQARMQEAEVAALSLVVVDGGQVVLAHTYRVPELHPATVTETTRFQAASVSKVITALGVLILAEKGTLDLDQDLMPRLKAWKVASRFPQRVTVRQILSHSAGFTVGSFTGYPSEASLPSLEDILSGRGPKVNSKQILIDQRPGLSWRYSGGGFVVLQKLIEELTHQSFTQYMQQNVLTPLRMSDSSFGQPPEGGASLAQGAKVPGGYRKYPELAAAGLWSTPSDLARAMIYLEKCATGLSSVVTAKPLLSQAHCQEMLRLQKGSSGLGVMVYPRGDGIVFDHGGVNAGFVAEWMGAIPAVPPQGYQGQTLEGLVIMTSASDPKKASGLINDLIRRIREVYHWSE